MKKAILFIFISYLLLAVMNFYTMPKLRNILEAAHYQHLQEPILDVKVFGYDLQDVQDLFYGLGQEGRQIYQNQQLAIDLFYPLFFLIGFAQFFLEMIKRSIGQLKLAQFGFWLTLFASFCDWSENMITFLQLKNFPNMSLALVQFGSGLTVAKLFLIFLTHLFFLYFCYLYFRNRYGEQS